MSIRQNNFLPNMVYQFLKVSLAIHLKKLQQRLYIDGGKVYLEGDDFKKFKHMFKNGGDGIAVDIVQKAQYPCTGDNIFIIRDGTVTGGMIPKVETCIYALEQGVEGVVIMDGKVPHAVLLELLTDHGAGTLITK